MAQWPDGKWITPHLLLHLGAGLPATVQNVFVLHLYTLSITCSGGQHRRKLQSTSGLKRRDTWMGFSQLKADVSHFAMGKAVLETATSEPQLQDYFRSCWVHSRLCCAFPLLTATSLGSTSETVLPGVGFTSWTVMLKGAAQMKPEWYTALQVCSLVSALGAFLQYSNTYLWAG